MWWFKKKTLILLGFPFNKELLIRTVSVSNLFLKGMKFHKIKKIHQGIFKFQTLEVWSSAKASVLQVQLNYKTPWKLTSARVLGSCDGKCFFFKGFIYTVAIIKLWTAPGRLLKCSWTAQTHELLLYYSWTSPEPLLNQSWIAPELHLNCSWTAPDLPMNPPEMLFNCSWNNHELHLNCSWTAP